jgi:hypothetical protein
MVNAWIGIVNAQIGIVNTWIGHREQATLLPGGAGA